jgi:hypothetical protein
MTKSITLLKDKIDVKISAIELITKEYKWKFARFFQIPAQEKNQIVFEFDGAVKKMITLLETRYSISTDESSKVCKGLVDFYKRELLNENDNWE